MSLERTKIRKALVTLLKGKTDAKENVVAQRSLPNWYQNLPAINIYLRDEAVEEFNQAPRVLKRIIDVDFQVVVTDKDEETLSDKTDRIMQQIEDLMERDDSLNLAGCVVNDMILSSIETEVDPGGEQPVMAARMTWKISYFTDAPRNRTGQGADADFLRANVDYKLGDQQPLNTQEIRAEDDIEVPQT